MWFWVRLYSANEVQKGCFEADVLLFGCLWVACGFGCACMGELICKRVVFKLMCCCLGVSGWHVVLVRVYRANELQKGCFEADVLLFGCLWVTCG